MTMGKPYGCTFVLKGRNILQEFGAKGFWNDIRKVASRTRLIDTANWRKHITGGFFFSYIFVHTFYLDDSMTVYAMPFRVVFGFFSIRKRHYLVREKRVEIASGFYAFSKPDAERTCSSAEHLSSLNYDSTLIECRQRLKPGRVLRGIGVFESSHRMPVYEMRVEYLC